MGAAQESKRNQSFQEMEVMGSNSVHTISMQ